MLSTSSQSNHMYQRPFRFLIDLMRLFLWGVARRGLLALGVCFIPVFEDLIFFVVYRFQRHKRRIIINELLKSYGTVWDKKKASEVARKGLRVQFGFQLRSLYITKITPTTVERYVPAEGLHHIDHALELGKGTIVLNPHFGPYLLIMAALGHRRYKVNQVALHGAPLGGWSSRLDQKVYNIKLANVQGKLPARFIEVAKKANTRKAFRALKDNQVVLFPSTGRAGLEWAEVKFMNRNALLNTGAMKMARMTGSVLIPAFVLAEKLFAKLVIEKPIETRERDLQDIMQEYANLVSSYIEKYPDHFCEYLYKMAIFAYRTSHPLFVN